MTSSFTRKRNLEKPAGGDNDWGTGTNANFDKLEDELSYTSSKLKNRLHGQNTFGATDKWEQFQVFSAQGGTTGGTEWSGIMFDGRYMYYCPGDPETFMRYDTTARFRDITSWEQIAQSSGTGGTSNDVFSDMVFDGRYLYFQPRNSDSFVRFDTTGVFTDITSWTQMAAASGNGGTSPTSAYFLGIAFDGRHVYYSPRNADSFVRYDTTAVFTDITSWEQIPMSSGQGAVSLNDAYGSATCDGRFVYYVPFRSDTFVRFDGQGAFTDITSWEQLAQSSGLLATVDAAHGRAVFDGRHVYYSCATASLTFPRFDTTGAFTDITNWEQMRQSSAQGGTLTNTGFGGGTFDGRYLYFSSRDNRTFVRYDTTETYTDITAWEQMDSSSAIPSVGDGSQVQAAFDGFYVYFVPFTGVTLTRFRANTTTSRSPTEYDQVS